jgi:hypothetical protein
MESSVQMFIVHLFTASKMNREKHVVKNKNQQEKTTLIDFYYLRFVVLFCCLFVTQQTSNLTSSCFLVAQKNFRKLRWYRVSAFFVAYRFMYWEVILYEVSLPINP